MRPLSSRCPITGLEEHDTWQHAFSDTDTARAIARFVCRVPRHETLPLRPRDLPQNTRAVKYGSGWSVQAYWKFRFVERLCRYFIMSCWLFGGEFFVFFCVNKMSGVYCFYQFLLLRGVVMECRLSVFMQLNYLTQKTQHWNITVIVFVTVESVSGQEILKVKWYCSPVCAIAA